MSDRPLPTVSVDPSNESPPLEIQSSSLRLVSTLAVAGALAGLAIVLVFQWANPQIEAWRAEVLSAAVTEVLGGAERYETAFLEGSGFTLAPTSDTASLDRVYVGLDPSGRPVGVALVGGEPGFQDVIRLIFGYDPETGNVLGMRVLESKETPGLGDKIEKDSVFVSAFEGVGFPLVGVKSGRETGADEEILLITGATISSRAVLDIINHRLEGLDDALGDLWTEVRADRLASGSVADSATPGGTPAHGGGS